MRGKVTKTMASSSNDFWFRDSGSEEKSRRQSWKVAEVNLLSFSF